MPLSSNRTCLTEHFSVEELTRTETGLENECPHSLAGNLTRLAEALEGVRELLGCPIQINSGYRSEQVNSACHGAHLSAHLFARAADFVPQGIELAEAFETIRKSGLVWDQLILEPTWIHFGIACPCEKPRQECLKAHRGANGMEYARV